MLLLLRLTTIVVVSVLLSSITNSILALLEQNFRLVAFLLTV